MNRFQSLREAAYAANMELPRLGLVLFTFGNVSVADRSEGVFAIKPSGVPYPELRPESMVIVDFDGQTVHGELRPSSDTLTHARLYAAWEGIGSIVHTHSTYATAWAPHLRHHPRGPYGGRYSLCPSDGRPDDPGRLRAGDRQPDHQLFP